MDNNQYDYRSEEEQITLQDYLRILYRGRWIILVSFLVVVISTAIFTFTTDPVYESEAKILVDTQGTMERALFNLNYLGNQTTMITNQVEILNSRKLAEKVVRYLEAVPYRDSLEIFQPNSAGEYITFRQQTEWIMAHLEVTPKKDTDVIEVKFQAGTPFESATICNVIADQFRKLNQDFNRQEFRELRQFLERQLQLKGEELATSEDALKNYRQKHKLVALDEETQELISRLAEAQAQLEATLVELQAAQEKKKNLEKQLNKQRANLTSQVTQVSSSLLKELQDEYAKLVAEKVKYQSLIAQDRIDPQAYQVELNSMTHRMKALQTRLRQEAKRIAATSMITDPLAIVEQMITEKLETESLIKADNAKMETLRGIVEQYDKQLQTIPEKGLELARLERQAKVEQNTYVLMQEKLEETKISEAGQKQNIRIVDTAIEPLYPIKPRKKLNLLLGALIGLGLGIGVTFLIEYFDDSIKNPDELEKMGFPIMAIIPQIETQEIAKKIFSGNGDAPVEMGEGKIIESRLVTHFDPKSPISEAYRTLRTNIQFKTMRNGDTGSAILVSSSAPKEGKSTTVANLAITMAQMGSKTLLVDTDLRRPVIHSIFNQHKEKGLTNYLMGKLLFDEVIKDTIVDNLYLVTSGPLPPNPSELISSHEMKNFLEEARKKFDIILFDSPPVIAVTDAAIMSNMMDGLILVVQAHQTQKEAVKRAKALLDNVDAKIIGCLLNGVNIERSYGTYYYYYYYHYYSYYGHDLKRHKRSKKV